MSEFEFSAGTNPQPPEGFVDNSPQTLTYNGDGTVNTITITGSYLGVVSTWVRTFSYTSGKLTGISAWVKQ